MVGVPKGFLRDLYWFYISSFSKPIRAFLPSHFFFDARPNFPYNQAAGIILYISMKGFPNERVHH